MGRNDPPDKLEHEAGVIQLLRLDRLKLRILLIGNVTFNTVIFFGNE